MSAKKTYTTYQVAKLDYDTEYYGEVLVSPVDHVKKDRYYTVDDWKNILSTYNFLKTKWYVRKVKTK